MGENILSWIELKSAAEIQSALLIYLQSKSNAAQIALFSLDYSQENMHCLQLLKPINIDLKQLSTPIDKHKDTTAPDPVLWSLQSNKIVHLSQKTSAYAFNLTVLEQLLLEPQPLENVIIIPFMQQQKAYSDSVIVFLNPKIETLSSKEQDAIHFAGKLTQIHYDMDKKDKVIKRASDEQNSQQRHSTARFLVYKSQSMEHIYQQIKKVAPTSLIAGVFGETGTGKDVVANEIHFASSRRNHPFIAINCASIPESLLESEMFGYKKNSHSQALQDYDGIFLQAGSGTLFLDEIGELPLNAQATLLRVLQNKTVRPIGASKDYRVDCRLIIATHQNLEEMVRNKQFRADLYYRLSQFSIKIPPLRERIEDIEILAPYFLRKFSQREGLAVKSIDKEAIIWLQEQPLFGNVRELQNLIEHAAINVNSGEMLMQQHFQVSSGHNLLPVEDSKVSDDTEQSYKELLEVFEMQVFSQRLKRFNGQKGQAAKSLDINYRTFYNRCKKLGIIGKGNVNE